MRINLDEIGIKVKVVENLKLKAIIGLDFGDFVVKGFRVMTSDFPNPRGDKLWLTPPSYQSSGGRYHPIFFMPDKQGWEALQAKIWEAYYSQNKEHFKKRLDVGDDEIIAITKEDLPP